MTVSSLDSSAYQWDVTQEGKPAPNTNVTPPAFVIPDVTGLALTIVRTSVTGGINAAQIQATVTAPSEESVQLHAQYRQSGATEWLDMASKGDWSAISGIVSDGVTYEVQAAFETFGGEDGTFEDDSIDVEADATAPAAITDLAVAVSGGTPNLTWTAPDSANYYGTRLYRGATTVFADATLFDTVYGTRAAALAATDPSSPSGVIHYWAAAINHSGVASAPDGPVTVTI
jgi:hypothetical protein